MIKKGLIACAILVIAVITLAARATSYSNPGGQGNRTSTIIITNTSAGLWSGNFTHLVNGNTTETDFFFADGKSSQTITFWFPIQRVIDEAKWYQSTTTTHGSWKFQGSNDNSTYTDIGSGFTLGGATTQTITAISGNTIPYLFYRMTQTSGTTSAIPWIQEIEFKTEDSGTYTYANSQGSGDRSATITITTSGITWSGTGGATPQNRLVNGNVVENVLDWDADGTCSGDFIKFNLGDTYVIKQARWFMDSGADTTQGTWKLQGSLDDSSYSDLSGSFALATRPNTMFQDASSGTGIVGFTDFFSNVTTYQYIKMLCGSGSRGNGRSLREMEFLISSGAVSASTFNVHRLIKELFH